MFFIQIMHLISLQSLNCKAPSRYEYLLVERAKSHKTMLYVADGVTRSIVVWNVEDNVGSCIRLPHSVVQGCTKNPHDDVLHVVLVEHETKNYVYFTFMSSQYVFRIWMTNLRNRKHTNPKYIVNFGKYTIYAYTGGVVRFFFFFRNVIKLSFC